jgi:hypothetical protein
MASGNSSLPARALAAAITALVAERAERDKFDAAVSDLFGDAGNRL